MKKNVIITAGPTIESIDEVMRITNMSTGRLGKIILKELSSNNDIDNIYFLKHKSIYIDLEDYAGNVIKDNFNNTQDLLEKITFYLKYRKIHYVVHSAAVGDYKTEFTTTLELMAENISNKLINIDNIQKEDYYPIIFKALQNSRIDNSSKISSVIPNLVVKLELTPKIINNIKKISPDSKLIGFKLLDDVSFDNLINTAHELLIKTNADYIVANDLSKITKDEHPAYIIDKDSKIIYKCQTKYNIASNISKIISTP